VVVACVLAPYAGQTRSKVFNRAKTQPLMQPLRATESSSCIGESSLRLGNEREQVSEERQQELPKACKKRHRRLALHAIEGIT